MRRILKVAAFLIALALAGGAGWVASGIGIGQRTAPERLASREQRFAAQMEGAVLDGEFTVAWPTPREGTRRDRYEIVRAVKLAGDRWRFGARIQYGGVDVTLPVVVPIRWAGNVPVIRLVDASFPGLGSGFGATIVFDGDRYAGTWDHGETGGFLYGTISRSVP